MEPPERVFAITTPGLEAALLGEARALGRARAVQGGVELAGDPGLHRRANLWLRTASRILLRIGEVPAGGAGMLERALRALPFERFRPPGEAATLTAIVWDSPLSARAVEVIGRRVLGLTREARVPPGTPASHFQLRVSGISCTVSVDSTGEALHRRGYRQEISRAPMRETLAAGVLLLAGYQGDEPLWDPMCGSGTLPIEAALLAIGRAPGLGRTFAFERWPCHDAQAWAAARHRAEGAERKAPLVPIAGSDLNAGSLGTARRNARRARLTEAVTIFRHDATLPWPNRPPSGLVVANLPYGLRVGERATLGEFYRAFGEALRRQGGWRAALLVAKADAERDLGFRPARIFPLENGGLPCRLLVGPAAAEP